MVPAFAQANSTGSEILQHLDHSISWYRRITSLIETIPAMSAAPARDDLHQEAIASLQNAFEYARARAATLPSAQQSGAEANSVPSSRRSMQQAYTAATQRIQNIQNRIAEVTTALQKASGKKRASFASQRDVLQSQLKLSEDMRNTLQKLLDFMNTSGEAGGTAGVLGHIADLEQTVPEVRANSGTKTTANAAGHGQVYHEDSAGILSLGVEIFTLMRGRVQLDEQAKSTDDLLAEVNQLRAPIRQQLRQLIQRSERISNQPEISDADQLAAARQQTKDLQQEFIQASNIIVPLGKQVCLLESVRGGKCW